MEVLLKEAEALSLPCFDLVPAANGDEVCAYWHGRRSDLPESVPKGVIAVKSIDHFLSVDQNLLDRLQLQGRGPLALCMFKSVRNDESLSNVEVSTDDFQEVVFEGGVPLTAKSAVSFPPLEALLLYGGTPVQKWLGARELQRWHYSDVEPTVHKEYFRHFERQSPLCMQHPPFARVGGWHNIWPDDDFYIPREMRLMVWTFQDSEPWYEIFLSPLRNYVIKERIT